MVGACVQAPMRNATGEKCWAVALVWGGTGVVWGCAVTINVSSRVSVMNEKRRSMQKRGALPMLGQC